MNTVDWLGNKQGPGSAPGMKAFNPYAAGNKRYGAGRSMPNIGPVAHPQGYAERDNKAQARKNAIMRRMKGTSKGNPSNPDVTGYSTKGVFK